MNVADANSNNWLGCSENILPSPFFNQFSLTLKVADPSGSMYVSVLGDDAVGKELTGLTAEQLYEASEKEENFRLFVLSKFFFTTHRIKVRGKLTKYKDTQNIQMNVVASSSAKYGESARELAARIENME